MWALSAADAFPLFSAKGELRWVAGWNPCFVPPVEPGAGAEGSASARREMSAADLMVTKAVRLARHSRRPRSGVS